MSVRERLDALSAVEVLAALRDGTLDPFIARPAGGIAARWLDVELGRLVETWPAAHPEAFTGVEARILCALAAVADERGRSEVPRTPLARSARVIGRELGDGLSWLRWRGSLAAQRVSQPGGDRVDRIILRRWPPQP